MYRKHIYIAVLIFYPTITCLGVFMIRWLYGDMPTAQSWQQLVNIHSMSVHQGVYFYYFWCIRQADFTRIPVLLDSDSENYRVIRMCSTKSTVRPFLYSGGFCYSHPSILIRFRMGLDGLAYTSLYFKAYFKLVFVALVCFSLEVVRRTIFSPYLCWQPQVIVLPCLQDTNHVLLLSQTPIDSCNTQ